MVVEVQQQQVNEQRQECRKCKNYRNEIVCSMYDYDYYKCEGYKEESVDNNERLKNN